MHNMRKMHCIVKDYTNYASMDRIFGIRDGNRIMSAKFLVTDFLSQGLPKLVEKYFLVF